jgi:uncharacterized protein
VKKRVIVTGGSGFIGTALCAELAALDYHVIKVGHDEPETQTTSDGITEVSWDGTTAERLLPYIDGAYGIIHLAGENIVQPWTQAVRQRILESRVNSAEALVKAVTLAKVKPSVFIQMSAIGYYGDTGERIVDENAAQGATFLAGVCKQWEDASSVLEKQKVRRVIVRSAPVLGDGGILDKLIPQYLWFTGGPLGRGTQYFSFVHLHDCVRAFVFLLEDKKSKGAYNVCAPHPVQQKAFGAAVGKALRRPNWVGVPAWLLKALYGDLASETMLVSQRVIPKKLLTQGFSFEYPLVDGAVNAAING